MGFLKRGDDEGGFWCGGGVEASVANVGSENEGVGRVGLSEEYSGEIEWWWV